RKRLAAENIVAVCRAGLEISTIQLETYAAVRKEASALAKESDGRSQVAEQAVKAEQQHLALVAAHKKEQQEAQRQLEEERRKRLVVEAAAAEADRKFRAAEQRRIAAEKSATAARLEAQKAARDDATKERKMRLAAEAAGRAVQARAEAVEEKLRALEADREQRAQAMAQAMAEDSQQQTAKAQEQRLALLAAHKKEQQDAQKAGKVCSASGSARITSDPMSAGRTRVSIVSPCRPGQKVAISYGEFRFERSLNERGQLAFVLDLFLGSENAANVAFEDNLTLPIRITTRDLKSVSKIAISWNRAVNIDLHALEYAARRGERGHVWAGARSTAMIAKKLMIEGGRGHGFLSTAEEFGQKTTNLEVYTFWHAPRQRPGTVSLLVDYETRGDTPRGDTCGKGANANVKFMIHRLSRGKLEQSERLTISSVPCGVSLSTAERFNPYAINELRLRR
ncbi:MAG: hypothetical protein ACR2PA_01410, partial [Hyphomicrobiaceae bacterium]